MFGRNVEILNRMARECYEKIPASEGLAEEHSCNSKQMQRLYVRQEKRQEGHLAGGESKAK